MKARKTVNRRLMELFLVKQNAPEHQASPEAMAAIERYPALASLPAPKHVLTVARVLDALPENDRVLALEGLGRGVQDVQTALAEMPPMPGHAKRRAADPDLDRLVAVIEKHSTPFNLAAFTAAQDAAVIFDETDKPTA